MASRPEMTDGLEVTQDAADQIDRIEREEHKALLRRVSSEKSSMSASLAFQVRKWPTMQYAEE